MDKSLTKDIKINHENFVKENTGNIKEFYKISSCIGRGKVYSHNLFVELGSPMADKRIFFWFLCKNQV